MTKRSRRSDAKHRVTLIIKQNFRCAYCMKPVMSLGAVQKYRKTIQSRKWVQWVSNIGLVHSVRAATIEHIKPLGLGGNNHIKNKCIVCVECNALKDQITNDKLRRKPKFS